MFEAECIKKEKFKRINDVHNVVGFVRFEIMLKHWRKDTLWKSVRDAKTLFVHKCSNKTLKSIESRRQNTNCNFIQLHNIKSLIFACNVEEMTNDSWFNKTQMES